MACVGYRRLSSVDLNLDRQDLSRADKTFDEKLSGKSAKDQPELQALLDYIRWGDSVVAQSVVFTVGKNRVVGVQPHHAYGYPISPLHRHAVNQYSQR